MQLNEWKQNMEREAIAWLDERARCYESLARSLSEPPLKEVLDGASRRFAILQVNAFFKEAPDAAAQRKR